MKIKFHLPNFVNMLTGQLNYSVISMLHNNPEYFYDNIEIGSVFDAFPMIWNGGRIVSGHLTDEMIEYSVPQIFSVFNQVGVPCRLTLTNPVLTDEHLKDPACNRILDLADNGMNEVIVFSELLEKYIREKHPGMKITSSTCKQIRSIESIEQELDKDYSLVVLDYNLNKEYELLSKITRKERCEILINAICNPECPRRGKHYRYIGEYQLTHCGPNQMNGIRSGNMDWECEYLRKDVFERRKTSTYLSPEDIYEKLVPMGFRNFKIEGRGNYFLDLTEQYVYYLVKPEYKDRVRYQLITDVLQMREASK
ncbi:MAG: hypothetical protein Q4B26_14480 [Eubacteriales bacterium]|nr:hypothetical protein [Eubacteriales bacterium]